MKASSIFIKSLILVTMCTTLLTGCKSSDQTTDTDRTSSDVSVSSAADNESTTDGDITSADGNEKTSAANEDNGSNSSNSVLSKEESSKLSDIINAAAAYDDSKAASLLDDFSESNPVYADCISKIINYWHEANADGYINMSGLPDDLADDDSLCLMVLGFGLNKDGSMRQELIDRLNLALECAEKYPHAFIAVTGGGTASENPSATEADAMAEWLMENGINESRIMIEDNSKTTVENAVFTYNIITADYPQIKDIAIITSDYHIPMACTLFNAQFLLAAYNDQANADSQSEIMPKLQIVAHAACETDGRYSFSMSNQAQWLFNLFSYNAVPS